MRGELAYATVDVPQNISEIYGNKQWGTFVDLAYPIYKGSLFLFTDAVVSSIVRFEYVDFNIGTFKATGQNIRDEIAALVFGFSFRPVSGTVLKANYRRHWTIDAIGNPTINTAGFQFGFASYF